ncbi:4Fe-4S dicluster domain-containing protein [Clostridium sp. D2Q-11]|uniref:4Fe-4S dicluster domain-containing protein n=1 Tax=Anaeromonas frigoriresistens TaxID=2683708 RepID=A0A942V044_9FIRM|nr:reductive dehalogenase domain-containing protein [Anaeromonas frigoriresistens]MBS4537632.1 4Fe-4S dicluster domain-containing protein [Anaeromonas frigoriresistens]
MKRIDERDTMFSRMSLEKDSEEYKYYYNKNPDKKEKDDNIRQRPQICGEGTATYDPVNSKIAEANFKFLNDIKSLSEGNPAEKEVDIDKETITKRIKGLTLHYGAKLVGVTKMKDYHWYSHRGRHKENYGNKVDIKHPYGIVFAVQMDKEMLNRSPQVSEIIDTSRAYVDAAVIGMQISYFIRELGYEARNHMDANYLAVLPLVAKDAGIGDIGRNGILITKEYGQMVRLGLVTTELPLLEDEYEDFGVTEFCKRCNRCMRTCPGKAIPEDMKNIDGIERWQINQEDCYNIWRSLGTDCGICISSCPFSQGIENLDDINSDEDIDVALRKHDEKHGIRPYIRTAPEWLK